MPVAELGPRRLFTALVAVLVGVCLVTMCLADPIDETEPGALPPLPAAELPRGPEFLRGVALPLYHKELDQTYDAPLDEIAELGADTASLVVTWSQPTIRSVEIGPDPEESRDDALVEAAIEAAHRRGLRVMLFPILKVQERGEGEWRGVLQPDDIDTWFVSYSTYILHYARLAQAQGVEVLSVGSELGSMESYEGHWRRLIDQVRAVYTGRLLYSANWDHYNLTPFWDAVDAIGLTAYYELTDTLEETVTLAGLRKQWEPIREAILTALSPVDRPIFFTEVGYYSQVGTAWHPWDYTRSGQLDLEQQYLCYRAFYEVWRDVPEVGGVFFWHWWGDGGVHDGSYTPRGKPAAEVVRHWFGQ